MYYEDKLVFLISLKSGKKYRDLLNSQNWVSQEIGMSFEILRTK